MVKKHGFIGQKSLARGLVLGAVVLATLTLGLSSGYAQWRWSRMPPKFPDPNRPPDRLFTFCRIMYDSVRREYLGHGWDTDYPRSDINFMSRFEEFTKVHVSRERDGRPNHVVITLADEELFDYPFVFMSDVGTAGFDELEIERLRAYLLKGGFLWVDDFWGNRAWEHWAHEIGKVLPADEYPILDIPIEHPIFRVLYDVPVVPQIPSIQYWRRSGGYSTSERGFESEQPFIRGITDKQGRIMVLMSHNTDIADGWEREGEEYEFFHRFSADAYAVGINVVLYAMSH